MHGLFEAQAAAQSDAPRPCACGSKSLSYGELNRRANQLARHLRQLGVGADTLVGLSVDRSVEMVVGCSAS